MRLKAIANTFALMDDETRFWIAQQVADMKNTSDIQALLRKV